MPINEIHVGQQTTTALTVASPRPAAAGTPVWLDLEQPSEDELTWLERTFRFHPLAIEDCRHFNQRAKLEAYDGYLFLSLVTSMRVNGDIVPREIEVFLGSDYMVTVHREPMPALDAARAHATANAAAQQHPDFVLWLIADQMVDAYFPLMDEIEDVIDDLEDQVLENATQSTLEQIYALKRQLVSVRKLTGPMREVMNALAGTRYPGIDPHTALYFRDAYDHLTRIYDLVETSRDLLGNALDIYLSTVSNRLSEIMKRLTLLTTVFMPISFMVGFGGMNFQQLPFDNPLAFAVFMTVVVLTPVTMLVWFWRSRWV